MSEWILTSDHFPEDGEEVVVQYTTGERCKAVACYDDNGCFDGWMIDALAFTAFMPPTSEIEKWTRDIDNTIS